MMHETFKIVDTVEYRKVLPDGKTLDMSPEGLIAKTNNHPSIWQRIKMFFGCYKCFGDAMMNYGLQHLATAVYNHYTHISVGTSSTDPADYTRTDVVAPVFTRVVATKGYETVYIENDTAVFTGIFNPSSVVTIVETGLHNAITGGAMGARQTSCSILTVIDIPFGIIWKVTITRA